MNIAATRPAAGRSAPVRLVKNEFGLRFTVRRLSLLLSGDTMPPYYF